MAAVDRTGDRAGDSTVEIDETQQTANLFFRTSYDKIKNFFLDQDVILKSN